MHKIDQVAQRMHYYSSTLSSTVRATKFGLLGVIWTLFSSSASFLKSSYKVFGLVEIVLLLKLSMIVIVITLGFDFWQYVAAYKKERMTFRELDDGISAGSDLYASKEFWYIMQDWSFKTKIILTIVNPLITMLALLAMLFDI